MSDVKTTVRTLKVFEAFAAHPEAMTLSELAATIGSPPSSCLLILRTLLARGYLYSAGRHHTYYPTRRLLDVANEIARHDPIIEKAQPLLHKFRDRTGETVALAKRQGEKLIYLASAESNQAVRVVVPPGTLRPLHSNATGKALLSALDDGERRDIIQDLLLPELTSKTITDPAALEATILDFKAKGYFTNSGEGAAELSSVSTPLVVQGEVYALSLMAPSYRLDPQMAERGLELKGFARELEAAFQGAEGDIPDNRSARSNPVNFKSRTKRQVG